MAYVSIYDARVRVFRPLGFTMSVESAERGLKDKRECANLGLDKHEQGRQGLLAQYKKDKGGIHALIEHTVASRLLPRRRGLNWSVFSTKRPEFIPDTHSDKKKFDESTRRYARTLLGLPFCHDVNAQSDGVLWVSWQRQPRGLTDLQLHVNHEDQFVRSATQRLRPVLEAVAAMYAVYRYCDPDSASNPLPYAP